ncbi:MAG: hypothetical protein KME59_16020 [Trichormus sp. ATA11-4-KO1]|jgi:hypothetical protein|nr:hypothetical protein [Trichormus sp. ATA11-4-KO1]
MGIPTPPKIGAAEQEGGSFFFTVISDFVDYCEGIWGTSVFVAGKNSCFSNPIVLATSELGKLWLFVSVVSS